MTHITNEARQSMASQHGKSPIHLAFPAPTKAFHDTFILWGCILALVGWMRLGIAGISFRKPDHSRIQRDERRAIGCAHSMEGLLESQIVQLRLSLLSFAHLRLICKLPCVMQLKAQPQTQGPN